jgi:hypothetical protein
MQGDRVVVNVYNGLGNESTSLHWHGIRQRGTNHMDGATGTTQCPIAPGQSFRYEWIVSRHMICEEPITDFMSAGRPSRYLLVALSQHGSVP